MQQAAQASPDTPTDPSAAVRVLIVDDEQAVTAVLTTMLKRRGLVPESVPSAADARSRASTQRYDVALVDVGLRDADGIELADELESAHGLAGRVILMTGGLAPRLERVALKPFDYTALLRLIGEVAATGRAQGAAAPRAAGAAGSAEAESGAAA